MKSLKSSLFIGLAAMALGGLASVHAQSPVAGNGVSTNKMAMHDGAGMDHPSMAGKMKQHMARHKAELHDKLKLTAAQEPAWKTFTDAMMPDPMPAHPDRAAMEKMPAPERMEQMLALSKERQGKMEIRLAALKTFYAALTPEQQKIFDTSHARMARRMHAGKHHH